MKSLFSIFLLTGAFTAYSAELQLHECQFKKILIEFTPSQALTSMLIKEVRGAVVYKVKYKQGTFVIGPRTDLAVIDELPSKSLEVTFFEHDEEDGIVYTNNKISIDLKSPTSVEAPVVLFASQLNDETSSKGKCSVSL